MDATLARMDKAEQQTSNIEDKLMENNEEEKKRETKAKEHDLRIREISDSLKRNNIRIIEVPEDEEREKGVGGLYVLIYKQIIAEKFSNLRKEKTSKSRKHKGFPLQSTKNDHEQGIS